MSCNALINFRKGNILVYRTQDTFNALYDFYTAGILFPEVLHMTLTYVSKIGLTYVLWYVPVPYTVNVVLPFQ